MENLSPAARRTYRNIALGAVLVLVVVLVPLSYVTGNWLFISVALPITIYLLVTGLVAHAWVRAGGGHTP